ncbi:YkvA family protein [Clostridium sp.]|uniref:YkvA family protein n=1 Tax=Clostridium sp. TaxID=1506 RepID=UPI002FCBE981
MNYIKNIIEFGKKKSKELKKEVGALYLAYKRKDVPWYAKAFALIVVGYAMSPIDLIPDFIPILGYLDDLILIPLGISVALKLIPKEIMNECRAEAERVFGSKKLNNWIAGVVVVSIWMIIILLIIFK